mmetsp:Transcript_38831/g.91349  ORF Transcript_38831/g.91349 Transcript_38831/m.91349 type:complete len:391 (-) Transcript_38831:634-1806(-)
MPWSSLLKKCRFVCSSRSGAHFSAARGGSGLTVRCTICFRQPQHNMPCPLGTTRLTSLSALVALLMEPAPTAAPAKRATDNSSSKDAFCSSHSLVAFSNSSVCSALSLASKSMSSCLAFCSPSRSISSAFMAFALAASPFLAATSPERFPISRWSCCRSASSSSRWMATILSSWSNIFDWCCCPWYWPCVCSSSCRTSSNTSSDFCSCFAATHVRKAWAKANGNTIPHADRSNSLCPAALKKWERRDASRFAWARRTCSISHASCKPATSRRRRASKSSNRFRDVLPRATPCQSRISSSSSVTCSFLRKLLPKSSSIKFRLRANFANFSFAVRMSTSFRHMSVSKSPILAPCSLQKSLSFSFSTRSAEHFSRHRISEASRKSILSLAFAN